MKLSPDLIGPDLTSIVLLDESGIYKKSDAILKILSSLRGPWRFLGVFIFLPKAWRDFLYDLFAKHRYQWFGKRKSCRLPSPDEKLRFLP